MTTHAQSRFYNREGNRTVAFDYGEIFSCITLQRVRWIQVCKKWAGFLYYLNKAADRSKFSVGVYFHFIFTVCESARIDIRLLAKLALPTVINPPLIITVKEYLIILLWYSLRAPHCVTHVNIKLNLCDAINKKNGLDAIHFRKVSF